MAVNYLYASAISTVISLVGLQWWTVSLLDWMKSDGLVDENEVGSRSVEREMALLLGSRVTIALLASSVLNVLVLVIVCLKTIFFVQLYPSETRKVLERLIHYLIYKGTFLPLVVPPNMFQVVLWSGWLVFLCCLKMFQSLARDRLEQLNASPAATPSKYFRVFSTFLLVLFADLLWIKLCMMIYKSSGSSLFVLLFFEPLSIVFETSQAIIVHGFQLLEIWQRHSIDSGGDFLGSNTSYKIVAGSLSEWKGILIRNCGFLLEMMAFLMAVGHYLIIWWLHGMAFHLVDAVLFLNLRALVSAIVKRVRAYIKLRKALSSLNGALPDATYEELCAFDDECAICREPMARAKKLSCNHLFHLACLRSWLDQGLTEVYSCPTCRRPLFLSNTQDGTSSATGELSNVGQLAEQLNLGLNLRRISGHTPPFGAFPNLQHNPSDTMWREVGFDSSWAPPWLNQGMDVAGSSSGIRSGGLNGVQMMMRQLTSVSDNYAHGSLDDSPWILWPNQQASGSSVPPSSSLRYTRNTAGLQFRDTAPTVNGNMPDILAMVDRVREVLPHMPDELIIQDLLRTNNINITVNNLLLAQ
ncbi:E3 ubiquitin protein ligase RIN2-like [Phoenix dactylifera]|uniref:E3 ubiquitin protein ligase RIN2-like n=1 Tax=Phoenix dactylifera TaxID=42345 RepID=A0A8B7CD80_PHODC|nr:E3 ubiquitin protein ligase RIN2-like [Phoenix dactylifera]XP_008796808.2 E3 ubiquitin protein ligase RIN2-like [Phoenix dactylifera]XP_008796809.2 E3 ubiquitin protein ligase RIN2-like [Phoenix dactylifera]